jgi:hypothetical protein
MFNCFTLSKYLLIVGFGAALLSGCLTTKDVSLAVRSANAEIQAATFTDPDALTISFDNLEGVSDSEEMESAETQLLKAIQTFQKIAQEQDTSSVNTKAAIAALQLRLTVLYIVTDRYNLAVNTASTIVKSDLLSETQRTLTGLTEEYATWRKVTKDETTFFVCGKDVNDENSSSCLDWKHYPEKLNEAQNTLVTAEGSVAPVLISPENSDIHAYLSVWKGRVGTQYVEQRSGQVLTSAQADATSKRLASVVDVITPYLTKQQIKDLSDLCQEADQTLPVLKRTQQLKNMMVDFDVMITTQLITSGLLPEDKRKLEKHLFKHSNTEVFKDCEGE